MGGNAPDANSIQCVFIEHMPSTLVGARRYACCCFLDFCSWLSPKHQTANISKLQLRLSTAPILLPLVFLISLNDSSNHLVLKPEPRAYSWRLLSHAPRLTLHLFCSMSGTFHCPPFPLPAPSWPHLLPVGSLRVSFFIFCFLPSPFSKQ